MSDVKLLAAWDGWCDPCGTERPLVLVEVGPRGLRSWLHGIGIEDRTLNLTCRVCGQWQAVPQHEEDDEPELVAEVAAEPTAAVVPVFAAAAAPIRTASFDASGQTVASVFSADAMPEPAVEVEETETPARSRWFAKKAPVEEPETPAVVLKAVAPDAEEEPARPAAAVRPTSLHPYPQARPIPVARAYRSPVRHLSATDTAPLALLAAGYDVVAAGAR